MNKSHHCNRAEDRVPPEILSIFRDRFEQRRKELRLTQRDMANKVGVSVNTIQSYESGNLPRGANLLIVAGVLKCSIDWLVGLEGDDQCICPDSFSSESPRGMYIGRGDFIKLNRLKLHDNEPETGDKLLFNLEWLSSISSDPGNVRVVMPNPSSLPNHLVLVDLGVIGIYQGCRYLVEINGHHSINQLSIRPGSVLHVASDDSKISPFEIPASEVKVVGRLILELQTM